MGYLSNEEFAVAVKQYQKDLYRLALAIMRNDADAQDAVSEAIVKAYENKNSLKDYNKFKSWIMKILVNTARTMLKRQQKIILTDDVWKDNEPVCERTDELWSVVMTLEHGQREVVLLYYYENLTIKEISSILRLPEGTVKSRLARAREQLKCMVKDS